MAVSITRPHPFDKATARQRVDLLAQSLSRKLSLRYQWEGDRLTFKRTGAKGFIDVGPDTVHVEIHTSPLLPLSESRLRRQVNAVLDEHIPPATADQDDAGAEEEEAGDEDDPPAASARDPDKGHGSPDSPRSLLAQAADLALTVGGASAATAGRLLGPLADQSPPQRARLHETGRHLRVLREQARLSRAELADRLGLAPERLDAIERGAALLPTQLLAPLAAALTTDPQALLERLRPVYGSPPDEAS